MTNNIKKIYKRARNIKNGDLVYFKDADSKIEAEHEYGLFYSANANFSGGTFYYDKETGITSVGEFKHDPSTAFIATKPKFHPSYLYFLYDKPENSYDKPENSTGGGKMRSRKSGRKRRRTLKKHKKTRTKSRK